MPRLASKPTLIRGAARGIGLAIARAFVSEGAVVWLTDIRDAEGRDAADSLGPAARDATLDVREEAQWDAVMGALLAAHGRLDVLVNTAGVTGVEAGDAPHDPGAPRGPPGARTPPPTWPAPSWAAGQGRERRAARAQGAIRNLSSRSVGVDIPGAAADASGTAASPNHTKAVALDAAARGWTVRCNSIHPAAVLTPMWEPMLGEGPEREQRKRDFVADTPLRRFAAPEEEEALAVLLASDEAP